MLLNRLGCCWWESLPDGATAADSILLCFSPFLFLRYGPHMPQQVRQMVNERRIYKSEACELVRVVLGSRDTYAHGCGQTHPKPVAQMSLNDIVSRITKSRFCDTKGDNAEDKGQLRVVVKRSSV